MPTEALVALTTFPTAEAAREAIEALVREGLVACGSLVTGVNSIYRWRGDVETASEVLVVLKLAADQFDALEARLVALHPYEVPELLAVPVAQGHRPYLEWLASVEGGK
jgi:periplasmic divalent cation tolerance protein